MFGNFRAPIDEGNDRTVVIKHGLTTADGLAVDWIYNHIYWTDTGKNTIELASYEGNMRKVLIKDDLEEPRAIAVNPLDGYATPSVEPSPNKSAHLNLVLILISFQLDVLD